MNKPLVLESVSLPGADADLGGSVVPWDHQDLVASVGSSLGSRDEEIIFTH